MHTPEPVFTIDLAGGEAGCEVLAAGCIKALRRFENLTLILVGSENLIRRAFRHNKRLLPRIRIIHTESVIGMDEDPVRAIKKKPSASIMLATRTVADGEAFGMFSPGHTGATITAAIMLLGLFPGIARPTLATTIPTAGGHMVLVDSGANPDLTPEKFLCFARLAETYMQAVYGLTQCRIRLLNIGAEANKGTRLLKQTHALLTRELPSFAGNIESVDVFAGETDVLLCDGFVGNVFIKLCEGIGRQLQRLIRKPLHKRILGGHAKTEQTSLLAEHATRRSILRNLRKFTNSENYGGVPLLGVKGIVLVGHGQARDMAVYNAIANALLLEEAQLQTALEVAFPAR